MKSYKFTYWDRGGGGTTIVESPNSIDVEEAVSAIKEQLLENGIEIEEMQVDEFREITNPIDKFIVNLERLGFIK